MSQEAGPLTTLGWREWLSLPDLGLPAIKAKIDTGARSSALHAAELELFERDGHERARFALHPFRRRAHIRVECEAPVVDRRRVSDSGGNRSIRPFIRTSLRVGQRTWTIELNLTPRDDMLFPMLLGRTAMAGRVAVDPARSFTLGRPTRRLYRELEAATQSNGATRKQ